MNDIDQTRSEIVTRFTLALENAGVDPWKAMETFAKDPDALQDLIKAYRDSYEKWFHPLPATVHNREHLLGAVFRLWNEDEAYRQQTYDRYADQEKFEALFSDLDAKAVSILVMVFRLDGGKKYLQKEIGVYHGISGSRVGDIKRKSLKKMRKTAERLEQ